MGQEQQQQQQVAQQAMSNGGDDDIAMAPLSLQSIDSNGNSVEPHDGGAMSSSENIQVFIRVRPLIDREIGNEQLAKSVFIRALDPKTIEVKTTDSLIKCQYDAVFDSSFSQEQVYERVKECTDVFLKGFNSTLFAYGQTGSGKSFTMFGDETDLSRFRPGLQKSRAGIIPRAIKDIFAGLVQLDTHATLYCSFVQIYNEHIYDLLRDGGMDTPLEIREDRKNGLYVDGLSEYAVRGVNDCLSLLQCGEQNRAVRSTHMNQVSSRSHSVFQLMLEQKKADGSTIKSKFNLVDLAGSEKWNMDATMVDYHILEMTNINLSLHTLGRCIATLSAKNMLSSHVPYRDSKLTRLLQDSLGGNTKTKIIATLSPSLDCIEESVSTLKFADRAKRVMVVARVNEHREIDPAYVQKLQDEITQLKALIRNLQSTKSGTSDDEDVLSIGDPTSSRGGEEMSLKSQLVNLIEENSELKHQKQKLQKELDQLRVEHSTLMATTHQRTSAGSSPCLTAGITPLQPAFGDSSGLIQAKQQLEFHMKQLKDGLDRFFKFEIEEEELRSIYERICKSTGGSNQREAVFVSPTKSGTSVSSPGAFPVPSRPRPPLGAARSFNASKPPAMDMMYRIRGKSVESKGSNNNSVEWRNDGVKVESDPEKEMEQARKAIEKQKKLQNWLIEKEKRELLKLQKEQDYMEEQHRLVMEREVKFAKQAAATKKKLAQLKAAATVDFKPATAES